MNRDPAGGVPASIRDAISHRDQNGMKRRVVVSTRLHSEFALEVERDPILDHAIDRALDRGVAIDIALGDAMMREQCGDDISRVEIKAIDRAAPALSLSPSFLPASQTRGRIGLTGDALQPAPALAGAHTRSADHEAGKRGVVEGEHDALTVSQTRSRPEAIAASSA
jgi:hypothetical protein